MEEIFEQALDSTYPVSSVEISQVLQQPSSRLNQDNGISSNDDCGKPSVLPKTSNEPISSG